MSLVDYLIFSFFLKNQISVCVFFNLIADEFRNVLLWLVQHANCIATKWSNYYSAATVEYLPLKTWCVVKRKCQAAENGKVPQNCTFVQYRSKCIHYHSSTGCFLSKVICFLQFIVQKYQKSLSSAAGIVFYFWGFLSIFLLSRVQEGK